MLKFINSKIFFLIVLTVVIFALYGKSINFELMDLDDKASITNSIYYISDIKNLPKIFFQDTTYKHESTYYRPVLMTSFSIESIIFGHNTKIYHLTNIIMYVFTMYLIYLFFIKLRLNKNISKAVVLLFTVHPILTSNVVYVSPRGEMFLTIFLLLAFISFINYIENAGIKNLILFFIFVLLSVLSKETAAMLILISAAFLYAFKNETWPLGRSADFQLVSLTDFKLSRLAAWQKKRLINILIFFTAAVLIYIIFRFIAISHPQPSAFATFKIFWVNAFNSLMIFTEKIFVPGYISVLLYDVQITAGMILVNSVIVCFVIFALIKNFIDRKKILFCIFWYLLFLFPNFFIFEQQILFHRLLLPLIGIEIFLVLLVEYILYNYVSVKNFLFILYIFVFVSFVTASWFQAEKYRTQQSFMINSYADSVNRISSVQFVDFCIKNGDYRQARQLLAERTKDILTYRDILQYASLEMAEGNIDKAEETYLHLEESITYDAIYKNLSIIYLKKKDYIKAFDYLNKFKKISQNDIWAQFQTANIYKELGKYDKALEVYEKLRPFYKDDKNFEEEMNLLRGKNG